MVEAWAYKSKEGDPSTVLNIPVFLFRSYVTGFGDSCTCMRVAWV